MQLLTSTLLLALLPATISAADQIPLKEKAAGWIDKAKAYIPSGVPNIPNPLEAGAAKIAAQKVEKINIRNYARKLQPKLEGEEEWLVYFTGGNKSCFGHCGAADLAWNESVPVLASLPKYKNSVLKLGKVNCDFEGPLCNGWAAALPAVWHFVFPQRTPSDVPLSPLHELRLNITTVRPNDIISIPRASKARYLEVAEYTGPLHPVDGWLQKTGLLVPWGYALWGFGSTPSWMVMIAISFFSRQYMSRRAATRPAWNQAGAGAGAQSAPAAAPAPAAAGGKKRR